MGWTADVHVLPGGTDEKKIAAVPYVDTSYTDRINSFGNGSISFPSDYPRLDEILDPVTDVGSLIWFKRDGTATDMAFFAQRWSEDVADDNSRLVKITGPGIGDALLGSIIEPYGTGEALDWIWGGKNILSNPGFEDCRNIDERMELWNDATSGTFTLTVDAATTGSLDFDATPYEVEVALELLGTITDCLVSGAGTEAEPWTIQYVDPPYPVATMTVTDTLTGGSSTLTKTTDGAVDPTPWTKVQRVDRGVPPIIATYASNGWQLQHPSSPTALEGDYSWRVNGLAAYAGHQQLVRVTPGMTYQVKVPIYTTDGADRFRWVLRTRLEELIASSTWPDDTVSATSTWDETTWAVTDVVIPDGVTEAIFRFAYVGSGNPDPYYTDYNEMNEGLAATSAGDIVDTLLDAAVLKGSLDWLEWNFTSSVDSNGTSWSQTALSFVASRGESIGQVLGNLAKFGIEFHVFWNGTAWELGLYENYDYDTYANGLGTDRSADDAPSILLGRGVTSGPIQANSPMANVVYAEGANGLWSEAKDTASIAAWDRREGYVADFGIDDQDTLDALAQAQLDERSVVSGDKLRLNSQSHQPYDAFDLGDTLQVTLPPRADKTPRRIVGLVTKLPTASNSSPEWEVDLDQASYGPSTAVAEGLRRVLTKFDKQPDAQLFGAGIPLGTGGTGAEVSLLVASADAPEALKEAADYVCTGDDDQVQIMAALAELGEFWGGVVQLTQGSYYCSGPINFPTFGGALRGAGMEATYIQTSADSPSSSTSFIYTGATWSFIHDLNVGVVHDGYEYAIDARTTNAVNGPEIARVNVRNEGTDSSVYGAVNADQGVTLRNVNVTYTNHSCDGFHAWNGRANFVDCIVNVAGSTGNGSGIGIYLNDITLDGSRVRGCTIGDTYVTGVGIDIACDEAIVTNNHVYATGGIQVRSGINDVILDNNVGTVTDLGTGTKIGLATGDTLTDDDAIHDNVDGEIAAITAKATPVTGDYLLIEDSAASNAKKSITIGDLPGGGGGLDLTTKGDIHTYDTDDAALGVGANGEALFADSGETTGLNWRDIAEADISDLDHDDTDAIHDNVASEISAVTAKGTPTTSDYLLIEDAADSNNKKSITIGDLPSGSGGLDLTVKGQLHTHTTVDAALTVGADGEALFADSAEATGLNWRDVVEADISDLDHDDVTAIHDDTASEISAVTAKATPISADYLLIEDSAAGNVKKSITIGDLPGGAGLTSPLTTKGDLWGFDTDDERIPIGTDDFVLTADSAQALGVKWAAAGSGTDGAAIHDDTAAEISAVTAKGTPTTADYLLIEDAADSDNKKSITIGDLPAGDTSPLTTKGDLHVYTTDDARLAVGTDDHVLTADAAEASGVKWVGPAFVSDGAVGFDAQGPIELAPYSIDGVRLDNLADVALTNPTAGDVLVQQTVSYSAIDRTSWAASSYDYDASYVPANAIDGSDVTKYQTESIRTDEQKSLIVDALSARVAARVRVYQLATYYSTVISIFKSDNGTDWTLCQQFTGCAVGENLLTFTHAHTARYWKIRPDYGGTSLKWSCADMKLYTYSALWNNEPGLASPLTTKGDLWGFDTDDERLPVGTNDHVLTADSTQALGVKWAAAGSGTDGAAIHDNVAAEISAITAKATPTTSDHILIEDAADSDNKKRITIGDLPAGGSSPLTTKGDLHVYTTDDARLAVGTDDHVLIADSSEASGVKWAAAPGGTDADAIHDDVSGEISAITEKATPVSADLILIEDSAATNAKKKVQIGNLPGTGGAEHTISGTAPSSPSEGDVWVNPYSPGPGGQTWMDALFERPSDETVHADDQEFTDALGGTEVVTTGTVDWTQKRSMLSVKSVSVAANDIAARLYSLTPTTYPVTIEAAFRAGGANTNYLICGLVLADGTSGTDDCVFVYVQTAASDGQPSFQCRTGTMTNIATGQWNAATAKYWPHSHMYLRLVWTAANTFTAQISPDGVSWDDLGVGDKSITLTPTHFGVGIGNWGASYAAMAAFEYLRVTEEDLS